MMNAQVGRSLTTTRARRCACTIAAASVMTLLVACGDDRNYASGVPGSSGAIAPEQPVAAESAVTSAPEVAKASTAATAAEVAISQGSNSSPPSSTSTSNAPRVADSAPRTLDIPAPLTPVASNTSSAGAVKGEVVVVEGVEPFKKLAQSSKFAAFRRITSRYVQIMAELRPFGERLADGTATAEDRAQHTRLEKLAEAQWKPINQYMWGQEWTEEDRAAMGWILYGGAQRK